MAYKLELRQVDAWPIASVRGPSSKASIGKDIQAMLVAVWAFLDGTELRSDGHNVVIYHDGLSDIEVGVRVARKFEGSDRVACSETPGGKAAAVTHRGPYHVLPKVHEAVHAWCRSNGHEPTGTAWEVYGDWSDDPEKLETEVLVLVKS